MLICHSQFKVVVHQECEFALHKRSEMYSTTRESVTVAKTFKFTLMSEDNREKIVSRLSTFYLNVNRYVGTDDFNECLSVVELKNRCWSLFSNQITQGWAKPIVAVDDSWTSRLITRNSQSILLAPSDAFDLIYVGMFLTGDGSRQFALIPPIFAATFH